jgi:competence protein ComFC
MEKLLNLIFIPECIFCHKLGSFFCDLCLASCNKSKLQFVRAKKFPVTFLFVYEYERFIRTCIRSAKYKNKHFAAFKVLSEKVALQLESKLRELFNNEAPCILPIPASPQKLTARGFNQAELIAQKFSKHLGFPLETSLLLRSKDTSAQYTNNKKQRFTNLKNAFVVKNPAHIKGKSVLVVDDVCTTGATFLEAARVLLNAGAKQITCISLARKSLVDSS